jgi:hypothetical protein
MLGRRIVPLYDSVTKKGLKTCDLVRYGGIELTGAIQMKMRSE